MLEYGSCHQIINHSAMGGFPGFFARSSQKREEFVILKPFSNLMPIWGVWNRNILWKYSFKKGTWRKKSQLVVKTYTRGVTKIVTKLYFLELLMPGNNETFWKTSFMDLNRKVFSCIVYDWSQKSWSNCPMMNSWMCKKQRIGLVTFLFKYPVRNCDRRQLKCQRTDN